MILLVLGAPLALGLISIFLIHLASMNRFPKLLKLVFAIMGMGILLTAVIIYLPALF